MEQKTLIRDKIQDMLSDEARFQRWLDVEAALAVSQAELGVLPREAGRKIKQLAKIECLDMSRYEALYESTEHPMAPLLTLFREAVGKEGQHIHLGATTQDIMDTGMMLLLKKVWHISLGFLFQLEEDLLDLSERHADTIMAGRTHNIQALPITFGFKTAGWAREIQRGTERLLESKKRIFVIQMSGAVGTMASFGSTGSDLQKLVAEALDLAVPDMTWHASRDRLVEFVCIFSTIAGTLARIAQEAYLLMGTETGELAEGWHEGMVGSTAMPHKMNPVHSQHIMASARCIRYLTTQIMEIMTVDHERNMVHFIDERTRLEELCRWLGELFSRTQKMFESLFVDKVRMRTNLDLLKGAMQSESVMRVLSRNMEKESAHQLVTTAATKAVREGLELSQLLLEDPRVSQHISKTEMENLLNPRNYTGQSSQIAGNIVTLSRQELQQLKTRLS